MMDAVERGETMIVTRNGNPVAELRPIRGRRFVATAELLGSFRGLPRVDYHAMRAESDQALGTDLIDG